MTLPDGGQWRVAGWALRESRSRKGGATRGETRRGLGLRGLVPEEAGRDRLGAKRLTGVGRRGEGPSEEEALAGELDPARRLGWPKLGLRKRGRDRGGLL